MRERRDAVRREEERYVTLLLEPLNECKRYRPQFGGDGSVDMSLDAFRGLYGQDPLYHWVGLDSELMYAAHKAAGGMTSIYRQLGIGCERLLRQIIKDCFHLTDEQVAWSYEYEKEDGKHGIHTLDARIDLAHVTDEAARGRVRAWLGRAAEALGLAAERAQALRGTVFEVRQGYKSADSKRQNADLRYCTRAYNENYLPVLSIVSTQASTPVCRRYRAAQLLVLLGTYEADTLSTFTFYRNVVGYDLPEFFERNSARLRDEFTQVLRQLLSPE
jgi:hypothetical protein